VRLANSVKRFPNGWRIRPKNWVLMRPMREQDREAHEQMMRENVEHLARFHDLDAIRAEADRRDEERRAERLRDSVTQTCTLDKDMPDAVE